MTVNALAWAPAVHWNRNIFILMKFSSMPSAASDGNFIKMTFSFYYQYHGIDCVGCEHIILTKLRARGWPPLGQVGPHSPRCDHRAQTPPWRTTHSTRIHRTWPQQDRSSRPTQDSLLDDIPRSYELPQLGWPPPTPEPTQTPAASSR